MNALRDVSKVWLVAKMVHTLFESILGNKALEERLQKAAGRRHARQKPRSSVATGVMTAKSTPPIDRRASDAQKRKFDDMEFGYSNGPPAPQMSYERSRPQSPVLTPSGDPPPHGASAPPQQQQMPQMSASSPPVRQSTDAFMGISRTNTRPTTPFNAYSHPGTPPDLFLHTRNSPKISEDLWQNYQPDQLFPPEANTLLPMQSPTQHMVDPALRAPPPPRPQQPPYASQAPQMSSSQAQPHAQQRQPPMSMSESQQQQHPGMPRQMLNYHHQDPAAWAQVQAMQGANQQHQPDDQWSTGSSTGPIVPTTLNVGDWFDFFGIPNGDMSTASGVANAGGGGGGAYG